MIGVVRLDDCCYRAKQFITKRCHARFPIGNNRGVIEVAFVYSTGQEPSTCRDRLLDLPIDQAALGSTDQRTDHSVRIARIADFQSLGLRHKSIKERVINRRLDNDAGTGHANLALVNENSEARGGNCVIEIRVLEYDERALPSEFENYF